MEWFVCQMHNNLPCNDNRTIEQSRLSLTVVMLWTVLSLSATNHRLLDTVICN